MNDDDDWVWVVHEERAIWVYGRREDYRGFYDVLTADESLVILWNYEGTPDEIKAEAIGCPYRKATRPELAAMIAMARARDALE